MEPKHVRTHRQITFLFSTYTDYLAKTRISQVGDPKQAESLDKFWEEAYLVQGAFTCEVIFSSEISIRTVIGDSPWIGCLEFAESSRLLEKF